MSTTIRDVAEAAGVSAMAVSAVLNGTGSNVKVSAAKAEHIRKVAKELRYIPNHLARSLRSRKTGMVAVVFQHLERLGEQQPYFPQLLNGVMAALFRENYTLALCPRLIQGSSADSMLNGRFDGVLWCRPDFTDASMDIMENASIPVVIMHAPAGTVPGVPTFCADNDGAMKNVVEHLSGLGHRSLAFLVDAVNEHTVEGRMRFNAFLWAAKSAGIAADILIWDQDAQDRILSTHKSREGFTGLICFSDFLAGQLLTFCETSKIDVPADFSVVGFDSGTFCETTKPKLTSVNQPVELMALAATNHLLTLIRETSEGLASSPTVSSTYHCGLDVRESTAAPRTH